MLPLALRPVAAVRPLGLSRRGVGARPVRPRLSGALPPGLGEDPGPAPGASTRLKVPDLPLEHAGSNGAGAAGAGGEDAGPPAPAPLAHEPPAQAAQQQQKARGIPHRWRLVAMMSACFVICNMDKVNMSVAIIPMAKDLGWTATERGLVSSSFFWGYALTQVPAGYISTRIGGAKVLMAGVALWSFGTLIAPPAAQLGIWALCATRVLVGLGEGFAPSAATSVLARQVPSTERSRAVTAVWGGLDIGSVVGLLLSGPLIRAYGWPSVFYLFALLGGVWCLFWPVFKPEEEDPAVKNEQRAAAASGALRMPRLPMGADAGCSAGASEAIVDAAAIAGSMEEGDEEGRPAPKRGGAPAAAAAAGQGQPADQAAPPPPQQQQQQQQQQDGARDKVPWGAFFRSSPVWAVTVAHFCFNFGYYVLLAWLPSYFEGALGLNVSESSVLTLIPYLAMVLMTPVVGPVADGLVKRGWSLTAVRKLSQGIAFVGPAVCMVACAFLTPAAPGLASAGQTAALVGLLSLGFALGAWSRAGLYCNHQDLSPKYASALLGITNTAGALPGVIGVTAAGWLLDATGSWPLALFYPTAVCQLFGAAFYSVFASSERQAWS